MNADRRALFAAGLVLLAACGAPASRGSTVPPPAPPPPVAPVAVAPPPPVVPPPAPPPAPIDPAEDARFGTAIRLDLDAIRAHPIGHRMGKAIAKLDPLHALASPTLDPLRDLDKVVWLGTTDVRSSTASQVIQTKTQGPLLTLAVRRLAPVAVEPTAASFEVKIKKRSANATLSPAVPPAGSPETVALLALDVAPFSAPLSAGATPGELVEMRLADPWKSFPSVPRAISQGAFLVVGRDDGGVDVTMTGTCTDEPAAILAAKLVKHTIEKWNVFPFRLVTKRALDTAKVAHDGSTVTVDVALAKDQVEALARILADEMNADLTLP